ncbi:MAG: hypothetical protein WBX19_08750, partial [Terracidiphilus sp.]
MSEESFRDCYERLTDDELSRIVDVRKDLVPEAALALDREVERRHFKRSEAPSWARNPKSFGFVVALIVLPLLISLKVLGRPEFVYPLMATSIAFAFTIWGRWELRRHSWFWATVGGFVLLHVVLILALPWRDPGWTPASVTMLASIVDLGIMLGTIGFVEKLN